MAREILPPKIKHTAHSENNKTFPGIGISASAGGLQSQDANEHWIMPAIEKITHKNHP